MEKWFYEVLEEKTKNIIQLIFEFQLFGYHSKLIYFLNIKETWKIKRIFGFLIKNVFLRLLRVLYFNISIPRPTSGRREILT